MMWNETSENISEYKYLGTILTNRNRVPNEIMQKSKSVMLVIAYIKTVITYNFQITEDQI